MPGSVQGGAIEYFRTKEEGGDVLRVRHINAMYNVGILIFAVIYI